MTKTGSQAMGAGTPLFKSGWHLRSGTVVPGTLEMKARCFSSCPVSRWEHARQHRAGTACIWSVIPKIYLFVFFLQIL